MCSGQGDPVGHDEKSYLAWSFGVVLKLFDCHFSHKQGQSGQSVYGVIPTQTIHSYVSYCIFKPHPQKS